MSAFQAKRLFRQTMVVAPFFVLVFILLSNVGASVPAGGRIADTGSGNVEKVTADFFGADDEATALAIQPDGKIFATGFALTTTGYDFAMIRYNSDGSVDDSFGEDGKVLTDLGRTDKAYAVALQPDGRIIAAGVTLNADADFGLVRYNSDGSLDTSFGDRGKVTTDFRGADEIRAVALLPDGSIIAAGNTLNTLNNGCDFAVARYTPTGRLDSSFDADGKVTTDFFGGFDWAFGVAVQADGKIVAAGRVSHGASDFDFGLARYKADGSLDSGFGADGRVATDFFGKQDEAFGIAVQPDDKIIVAGRAVNSTNNFAAARYNVDGSLDAGFGESGRLITEFGGDAEASSFLIQPDGKIVLAGAAFNLVTSMDFAAARYNVDGTPDLTFGNAGRVTIDFSGKLDGALAVALHRDGRIVAAGATLRGATGDDFALAVYEEGIRIPVITGASVNKRKLIINGERFDAGAQILINGAAQKTINDADNPATRLIGKKAGKKVGHGDKLVVRNSDGRLSLEFLFR